MLNILKNLLAFLDGPSRLHLAFLLVPMLLTAGLEMMSIAMILPLIQVLLDPTGTGVLVVFIKSLLPNMASENLLLWVSGLFGGLFVIKNILLAVMVYVVNAVMQNKLALFTSRMFTVYLDQPLIFHLQRNSAEITRNLITSANSAFEAIRLFMLIILELMLVLMAGFLLLYVDTVITTVAASVLFIFAGSFYLVSSPYFRRWGTSGHNLNASMIKTISQSLGSIRDIKLLHCQGEMSADFTRQTLAMARAQRYLQSAGHLPRLALEVIVIAGFLLIIFVSVGDGSVDGALATLGLFGMASLRLMPSINRILTSVADMKRRTADIGALYDDLGLSQQQGEGARAHSRKENLPFTEELKLENLSFQYDDAARAALAGINLSILKGESIGVVGPSGAGKSTLTDILLGLLGPQSGKFQVDGKDALTEMGAWQKHVGFVPQQIYLIDDSLRRNIAFGIADQDISDTRIDEVISLANLSSVIAELPNGLDTLVGETGTRLSGGQRQRVAIARALYRNPSVLIFDEATAALDNETEHEITTAIGSLAGDKTLIIIAHRLSTVRGCDRLVYMKEGRIVASGSFEQLLETNDEFRRLAKLGKFETVTQT